MVRVGTYDAKTRLSELLALVESGQSIIITRHGEDIAYLVPPPGTNGNRRSFSEAVALWRSARKGVKLGGLKVRDLINEGRR